MTGCVPEHWSYCGPVGSGLDGERRTGPSPELQIHKAAAFIA